MSDLSIWVSSCASVKTAVFAPSRLTAWENVVETQHIVASSKESVGLWAPVKLFDGATARRKGSVELVSALVVDIDDGETWAETLSRFDLTWWAYTTFNHAEDAHRFRMVFPLKQSIQAEAWKPAWQEGIRQLSLHADASCCDVGRIYYLPGHADGAAYGSASNIGDLLDISAAPAPVIIPAAKSEVRQAQYGCGDYKTLDLYSWAASNGAKPRQECGGEGKIFVECPWKDSHTDGKQGPSDTYLLDKGDGWPVFYCAHSHCRQHGFKDLLSVWGNADAHCRETFSATPRRISRESVSSSTDSGSGSESDIVWPVIRHGKTGDTIPGCEANAQAWMEHKFAGAVRYNELTEEIELSGSSADDAMCGRLLVELQTLTQSIFHASHLMGALAALAGASGTISYHPVRQYLEALPAWDREDTISGLIDSEIISLQEGADEVLCKAYLRAFFVGAVARQMRPGCKHDCALIFQGSQGIGKSSFFRAILPEERWFCDSMGDLDEKDSRLLLGRSWIIEWSELESVRRSNMGSVKAFLSAQDDEYRAPYARMAKRRLRRCVIVGSTNEVEFIRDQSGARRFWVIPVANIDVSEVRRYRDRLWSEAVAIYSAWDGVSLPPWALDDDMTARQEMANRGIIEHDPWEDLIVAWLDGDGAFVGHGIREECTAQDALTHVLNIPEERQDSYKLSRVGKIIRAHGYRKARVGTAKRKHVYRREIHA